jgi:hypothetical protein
MGIAMRKLWADVATANLKMNVNSFHHDGAAVRPRSIAITTGAIEEIAMAYPPIKILDATPYNVRGKVVYMGQFCSNDDYSVTPTNTWTGPDRAICLLNEINALVKTPNGDVWAKSYTSSGTAFSQYAVIQMDSNVFEVVRLASGAEDLPPADYVEPTEKQK